MQNELHKEAERRKGMRQKRVNFIANIVEKAKSENKRTYGVIAKLVKESKSLYPDLTDHTVQNELRRRKRQKKVDTTVDVLPSATTNNPPVTNIDALMPSTSIDKPTTGQLHSSDTGLIVDPSPDNPRYQKVPTYHKRSNRGGRPVSSSKKRKIYTKKATICALNFITETYHKELIDVRKTHGKQSQLPNGRLDTIIQDAKCKYKLPQNQVIKKDTIRKRLQTKRNLRVIKKGPLPPIHEFEPLLVEWLSLAYNSCFCLSVGKALCLANSLIRGTIYEQKMKNFKEKLGLNYVPGNVLEEAWFSGFMECNKDKLKCTRGHNFSLDRDSWSTYQNFSNMYNQIETSLIECDVAEKIDPV